MELALCGALRDVPVKMPTMKSKIEPLARIFLLAACLAANSAATEAACPAPASKHSADGWDIESIDGTWIARSTSYPGL